MSFVWNVRDSGDRSCALCLYVTSALCAGIVPSCYLASCRVLTHRLVCVCTCDSHPMGLSALLCICLNVVTARGLSDTLLPATVSLHCCCLGNASVVACAVRHQSPFSISNTHFSQWRITRISPAPAPHKIFHTYATLIANW